MIVVCFSLDALLESSSASIFFLVTVFRLSSASYLLFLFYFFCHKYPIVVCCSSFFLPQFCDRRLLSFFLFFFIFSTNDIAYERFTRSLVVRETQKILAAWSVRAPCGSLSRVVIGFRCCLLDVISDVNIPKGRPNDVFQ